MKTDRAYEYNINKLIPIAEKEAKKEVALLVMGSERRPGKGGVTFNHCFFTEFFHAAMKRLAIKAGLRTF